MKELNATGHGYGRGPFCTRRRHVPQAVCSWYQQRCMFKILAGYIGYAHSTTGPHYGIDPRSAASKDIQGTTGQFKRGWYGAPSK